MMAPAKVYRGIVSANAFGFFFSAGQGCLVPFLSLYFLYLGMSPFQTGLLLGVKALTGSLSCLFWTQCFATTTRRLKFVLILSMIVLILSHLVMVLMPTMDSEKVATFCSRGDLKSTIPINCDGNTSNNNCAFNATTTVAQARVFGNFTTDGNESSGVTSSISNFSVGITNPSTTTTTTTTTTTSKPSSTATTKSTTATTMSTTISTNNYDKSRLTTSSPTAKEISFSPLNSDNEYKSKSGSFDPNPRPLNSKQKNTNVDDKTAPYKDIDDEYWNRGHDDGFERKRRQAINSTADSPKNNPKALPSNFSTVQPIVLQSIPDHRERQTNELPRGLNILEKRLMNIQSQVFSAMLVLVIISEMFSSPAEFVADELYATFLESSDQPLSRRRSISYWSLIGGAITPWVVVAVVDHLPCHVPPFGSHRILVHFWAFAVVHCLTLLFSLCYPTTYRTPDEQDDLRTPDGNSSRRKRKSRDDPHNPCVVKRWASLVRGLRVIASDGRALLSAMTVFVVGLVQGCLVTFLPWALHQLEKDGSEFFIGAAIGVAGFGDLITKLFGTWKSRKIGHVVCIILSLLIAATRLTLYGFLTMPWIAVVGELANTFGTSMVITAAIDHPALRRSNRGAEDDTSPVISTKKLKNACGVNGVNSYVAAEAMSVHFAMRLLRSGFGFSIGCCVAGVLVTRYGLSLAFCVAGGTAVVCCLIFGALYPCCRRSCVASPAGRKKRATGLGSSLLAGRYKKISRRGEEEDDDDEDDEEENGSQDGVGSEEEEDEEERKWLDSVMRKHKS